ncbi:MAG TPA: class I SAM-dependent methyltransferase [Candidatus Limnocylindrales bacterium]|nr:class I SAM-dependent methyltransferase [Candidatus Limnocylindrales bacterium]
MTQGESFRLPAGSGERWPDNYERGRPGWPPEVIHRPGLPPAATVLDLGAGTGKLTRLLISHFDRVIAVEPQEAMRRWLVALCPDAHVIDGTAEHIPLGDASVDAVFVAEAFHKFDDEPTLREIARVLRPRGVLVLMWNIPAGPTEPSIAAVERLLDRVLDECGLSEGELGYDPSDLNTARVASGEWRLAFTRSPFEELQQARLRHTQILDPDGLVAFLASMGWIADLPEEERLPLLDEIRSLLAATEYRRPWETHVYWTRLPDGAN